MSDTDRYFVNPLDDSAAFAEWRRSLERRISSLEGAPLVGAQLRTTDPVGNDLVTTGRLTDGSSGIEINSAAHNWAILRATGVAGWTAPHLSGASYNTTASVAVTSGSFTDTFGSLFGSAFGTGIEALVPWSTGSGTAGEVRLTTNTGGTTDAHTLPAASSGVLFCRWLHGTAPGIGPLDVRCQVRRTSGAGNVTVFGGYAVYVQDPAACSVGGTWL